MMCVGFVGCGGGPKLVPVKGTITQNGKALEGAQLAFTPDPSNEDSTTGTDITGPEGNYMAMYQQRSGLAPGKYTVLISKTITPASATPTDPEIDPYMAQVGAESAAGANIQKKAAPVEVIEDKFSIEVPPEGGVFDHDVKAKATPK